MRGETVAVLGPVGIAWHGESLGWSEQVPGYRVQDRPPATVGEAALFSQSPASPMGTPVADASHPHSPAWFVSRNTHSADVSQIRSAAPYVDPYRIVGPLMLYDRGPLTASLAS